MLAETANELLPIQVDEITTFERALSSPTVFSRFYRISHLKKDIDLSWLITSVPVKVCSSPQLGWVIDHGGTIREIYIDQTGDLINSININFDVCESIAQND
mgnify:FL=1